MNYILKITLIAARANADMKQEQVARRLTSILGDKVNRQKVSYYEKHPDETPMKYADAFSKIYNIPRDNIFFNS